MEIKKTITSIFIVPSLKIDKEKIKSNGYINAYAKDESPDAVSYENCVYLLFKPSDLSKFRSFLDEEYERTKSVIDDYDYEGGYVVVVYKLNPKFNRDYKLIKEGLYSRTSKEFQSLFSKNVKVVKGGFTREEISLQYRVFNKTEDMIIFWEDKLGVTFDHDQEVWHGYEQKNEILNINKLKEYV
jgi:hypothetical protein